MGGETLLDGRGTGPAQTVHVGDQLPRGVANCSPQSGEAQLQFSLPSQGQIYEMRQPGRGGLALAHHPSPGVCPPTSNAARKQPILVTLKERRGHQLVGGSSSTRLVGQPGRQAFLPGNPEGPLEAPETTGRLPPSKLTWRSSAKSRGQGRQRGARDGARPHASVWQREAALTCPAALPGTTCTEFPGLLSNRACFPQCPLQS